MAEVRLTPIRHYNYGKWPWYDASRIVGLQPDFVMIDGPPMAIGRVAGLLILWDHLAPGWEVWLDDWNRDHEQGIVKDWQERYPIQVEELLPTLVKITADPSRSHGQ